MGTARAAPSLMQLLRKKRKTDGFGPFFGRTKKTPQVRPFIVALLCLYAWLCIIEAKPFEQGDANLILPSVLDNFPEIFGTTIAYDPEFSGGPGKKFAPYFYRVGEKVLYRDLAESYDYLDRDWYLPPKESGQAIA